MFNDKIKFFLVECRIYQWIKNLLLFAPLIFGHKLFNLYLLRQSAIGFFSFCLISSSVYVLNDIGDLKKDKLHPKKCLRPLASGNINLIEAYILFVVLLILGLSLSYFSARAILPILIGYLVLNIFYSVCLKHIVILDFIAIVFMYLFRVYAGGLIVNISISPWLLLCTLFLSLFIIIAKRLGELINGRDNHFQVRDVLNFYNISFLNHLLIVSLTSTVIFYALYSISIHSGLFIWSIFPVIYGLMRYWWLIEFYRAGEEPELILYKDMHILISIVVWIIFIIYVLYFYE